MSVSLALEAEMYRCKNSAGETTYQDTQCASEAANVDIKGLVPRYSETREEFTLYGSTRAELYSELARKGPKCGTNEPRWGCATWKVRWNTRWVQQKGSCRVSSFKTFIAVVYRMPYWPGSTRSGSALAEEWNKFYKALKVHEDGHGDIAIRAGDAIDSKVARLGSFTNCSELESAVNEIGYSELEKYNLMNAQYDLDTQHGRTQDAIF